MYVCMYMFTTLPHPHGHWQIQELLGNYCDVVNVHTAYVTVILRLKLCVLELSRLRIFMEACVHLMWQAHRAFAT